MHGQLKSLDESIRQIETRPATEADLEAVTSALQRLDPIWEVLYPEEQRRVLELLVDEIDVGKTAVTVQFRADEIRRRGPRAQPGDQILVMSNGGFGGIHGKILEQLKQKA